MPCAPATLHAWQAPAHAVLQQNPSTQLPLLHWLPDVQAALLAPLAVHVAPAQ